MDICVNLTDIVDGLESQGDELQAFLNTKTGDVVRIFDEEFRFAEEGPPDDLPDWQKQQVETAREILNTNDYLELPDRFEINEYGIMEDFCLALEDDQLREEMYQAIKGRGAFARFKGRIHRHGLADDWYAFRAQAFKRVASDWCERHSLPFTDEPRSEE